MTKARVKIGYAISVQSVPGVWNDQITEHDYSGEVLRDAKQWMNSGQLNDNLNIGNRLSIVSDDYASTNFSFIKYVKWSGVYWNVSNIEIQRPRIILSLGGVYNGDKA